MVIFEIIDSIITEISDETGRTQRQFQSLKQWAKFYFRATVEACTGFGKTRIGTEAIKLLRRKDPARKVIVVVPTELLQKQWRGLLDKEGLDFNTEVWIINSLILSDRMNCSLLICDEIHNYAAPTFKQIFNVVNYDYILGLTATLERNDGKHDILKKQAPICDIIPLHLARQKGWVAKYDIYNLGLELSESEMQFYDENYGPASKLSKWTAMFGYDIQLMIKCQFEGISPMLRREPTAVQIARSMGWEGHEWQHARTIHLENMSRPRGQKLSVWGNDNHPYHPSTIVGMAVQARKLIAKRKEYLSNHPVKHKATLQAYKLLDRKTISFTETKEAARAIQSMVGENAVSYYTGMPTIKGKITKSKAYVRESNRAKFMEKHPDRKFELKEKDGKFIVLWQEEKLLSEKAQKQEAIRKLKDNRYKIDFISSVRSLNEGADIPDLELAIIHSRNTSARVMLQRSGRVARLFEYTSGRTKKPVILNLYIKGTKDESWLKASLKKSVGYRWINSLEDILQEERFVLTG